MTISEFEADYWDDSAALQQRLDLIASMLETSHVVTFFRDPITLETLYITPNVERILGYPASEIVRDKDFWQAHIHPDALPECWRSAEAAFATRAPQVEREYRFLHKSGKYRWLRSIAVFGYDSGRAVNRIGHLTDITARKLPDIDIAIRASILPQFGEAVIATDPQLRLVYINSAAEKLYRLDALASLGRPLTEFWASAWLDRLAIEAALRDVEATGVWQGREMQTRGDGSRFFAAITLRRFNDARGEHAGVICAIRDETVQHRLENELRESQEKLRVVTAHAAEGIAMINEGAFVYANPAFLRLLNVTEPAELQSSSWLDLIHPDDLARAFTRQSALMAGERADQIEEFRFLDQGGVSRYIEVSESQTTYHDQPAVVYVVRDISERRREDEVRRLHEAALGGVGQAVIIVSWFRVGIRAEWQPFQADSTPGGVQHG